MTTRSVRTYIDYLQDILDASQSALESIAPGNPTLVASLSEELNRWLQKTNDPWIRAAP